MNYNNIKRESSMCLTYLVSTMNSKVLQRKEFLGSLSKALIIDQRPKSTSRLEEKNIRYFTSQDLGLSLSRNQAIVNCDTRWAYILDDDIHLLSSPEKIIQNILSKNPNVCAIVFNHYVDHKLYYPIIRRLPGAPTLLKILSATSFEIAFNADYVKTNQITFDTDFGLGSIYQIGEEAIFLSDIHRSGGEIYFCDHPCINHPGLSTGLSYPTEASIQSRGAFIQRISPTIFTIIAIMYTIKAYPLYKQHFNPLKFFRLLRLGKLHYTQRKSGQ